MDIKVEIRYVFTMERTNHEIVTLINKVARLEKRLDEFIADYRKRVRILGEYTELLHKHSDMQDEEIEDAFDRIKNIELKFFPQLASDIRRLGKIIGDAKDGPANPLDKRKR